MSKIFIILISISLATITTFAQAPMSGQYILPQIGDTITYFHLDTTGINLDGTGTLNQKIWDFSEVNILSTVAPTRLFCLDPVESPHYEDNLQSNLLIVQTNGNDTLHASVKPNSLSNKSQYSELFFLNYEEDSLLLVSFPLSLGDTYTCNFAGSGVVYSGNMDWILKNGLVDAEVDGYGTMLLPDGTIHENVYRVKIVHSFESSLIMYGSELPLPNSLANIYYWFSEYYTMPIVAYSQANTNFSDTTTFYFQSKNYIVKAIEQSNFNFDFFPNPAQNYLELNNIPDNSFIEIYDMHGKLLYNNELNKNKIYIANFKSGLYIIIAKNQGKIIWTGKFIKN
ncbi:MAG TPA: T9SS type A sorting domain-containing protein [Bacteroidales bacterium]|nr:T9SS type A sorting domain-containing protein [Bacteroidales bacterium]